MAVEQWARENEMVGRNHQIKGPEFEQTLGDSEGEETWRAEVLGLTESHT